MAGNAAALRARLATGRILTIPGCYDAMSAKLVEQAGFERAAQVLGLSQARLELNLTKSLCNTHVKEYYKRRPLAGH